VCVCVCVCGVWCVCVVRVCVVCVCVYVGVWVWVWVCVCVFSIEMQIAWPMILVKFDTGILLNGGKVLDWVLMPYPYPWVQWSQNRFLGECSFNSATWQNLTKTKVVGHPCFSGGGSHCWACNLDLEGPWPHVLLEMWSIIFRQSL
jgi:hypothetical protein